MDPIIANLEKTAVKVAAQEVMNYLIANVWAGFAWPVLGPVVGLLVSYVASILMEKLDWVSFMVVSNWKDTGEGKDFVESAAKLEQVLQGGDEAAIEQARKEKEDAFRKLIGLAS